MWSDFAFLLTRRAALLWVHWRGWIDFAGRQESIALQ